MEWKKEVGVLELGAHGLEGFPLSWAHGFQVGCSVNPTTALHTRNTLHYLQRIDKSGGAAGR